jgi:DNA-binding IclR family transcriptional regulator
MLPALLQLPGARIAASACVVYLALLTVLDNDEYRAIDIVAIATATGYGESAIYDALTALARHGFLDRRGDRDRKYRLLSSQRSAVADQATRPTASVAPAPTP